MGGVLKRRMFARWATAFCLCFLCACPSSNHGSSHDAGANAFDAGPTAPLPDAVDAVLAARCRKCHSDPPQHDAPFPLVTWQNTHAEYALHPNEPIYELM